ncbi:unnamed protein product [Rotaria sp. Silwood2]|nr:unnamed protein product [Rotaria sp. Silwood2]CAF2722109.1 unnamed protein product [Rotaria sp. Silwood2]CAF3141952.1 unnamed protein product [Rotaria sp. Silwood2]CAF3957417.1 unnamed protein product [Rotaria sp. Silwood2]CAF4130629.1 unnamed protein product [Rotaria sp. Silwood2]
MSSVVPDNELKSQNERTVADGDISSEPSAKRQLTFRTYKNLFVISMAFLLQFTAFQAMSNLQSSLNTEANVGVNSLSIIYAFLIISSIFLPHPLIALLGLKWTIVVSQIPYLLYLAANCYPKAYLMYPTAALVGLAAAPLWTSKCSYLTDTGAIYAESKLVHKNVIVNRFFAQVWGNLISYVVLKPMEIKTNGTITNLTEKYNKCGADFSEQEYKGAHVTNQIDRKTIQILCIVYVCICICSILIIISFLNQRRKASKDNISLMFRHSVTLLVSTVKHMRHVKQLLLIPLTIWSGLEQSFLGAQFTLGFVSCTLNAKYVGLILIAYGICDSIGSFCFGQLVKFVGRWPCFVIAAMINYSLIITMFIWKPTDSQIVVLFVLAGLWGAADAVWQTQINSFYGVLFTDKDEAAFSNYRLWESSGFVLFYIITPYIRIRIGLIILLIFLTLGMTGYGATEYLLIKKKMKVADEPRPN